jgi:protein SCO1/2
MRVVPIIAAALLLAGCGSSKSTAPTTPTFPKPAPSAFRGTEVPRTPAPAFTLHDDAGRTVTLASQRGHWTLVTFLYTHCPDVCPLIAANLNKAARTVPGVGVLAVSVDPKGDTPAAVRAYVKRMHLVPRFRYLIGTATELRPVWTRYHVAAQSPKGDVVTHVAYTMLVDPSGKQRLIYDSQVQASMVVHDLRVLLHAKSPTA